MSGRSRGRVRLGAGLLLAPLVLTGCFATTKHVRQVETDLTQHNAWTDERIAELEGEVSAVRSENEALRLRMTDLESQLAGLGGEVSNRLTELEQFDQRLDTAVSDATQRTAALDLEQDESAQELAARMNVILEEVVAENAALRERIEALESSAFTFGRMHTVQKGESVASIAAQYGVTAEQIVEANGLSNANLIQVGQELLIPGVSE
jgi:LysM repeat protein